MNILMESTSESPSKYKFKTTVSLLMLMATWLADCPAAVDCFLREERHVPYLISQVSSPETSERALLTQGLAAFLLGARCARPRSRTGVAGPSSCSLTMSSRVSSRPMRVSLLGSGKFSFNYSFAGRMHPN